jgi:hypothetical protein
VNNLKAKVITLLIVMLLVSLSSIFLTSKPALAVASLRLTPDRGGPSSWVTLAGTDFPNDTSFTVKFEGTTIGSGVTGADGSLNATLQIPSNCTPGSKTIIATAGGQSAPAIFIVLSPEFSISPAKGGIGTLVQITGRYFIPNTSYSIKFENTSVGSGQADGSGYILKQITVPSGYSAGKRTITLTYGSSSLTGYFTLLSPNISVSPLEGTIGASITISGINFASSKSVNIKFEGTTIASSTSYPDGSFQITTNVPSGFSPGYKTISATVNNVTETVKFQILPGSISISPDSGTIGTEVNVQGQGFNYNQVVSIYFRNSFVVSTISNDSGDISASFTVPESPAGTSYVVAKDELENTSPNETRFNVFPVLQFPGPERGTVGTLVSVKGYGFSANSPVYINIEDATWNQTVNADSLGSFYDSFEVLDIPGGVKRITATDSQDNSAVAEMTFFVEPSVSLVGATSGQIGTSFTIQGRGFLSEENDVSIFWGDFYLDTIQCDKDGSFDFQGSVPEMPNAIYQVSAKKLHGEIISSPYTSSFTVIPTAVFEHNTGYIGMQLNISGTGFKPNTNIELFWDSTAVSETISTSDSSGSFTGIFTVPVGWSGAHEVIVSDGVNNEALIWIMESDPPPIPVIIYPVSGARIGHQGNQTPTFSWSAVDDQSGVFYNLSIASDEIFNHIILTKEYLTTNTYTLTINESLKKGLYFWRVNAIDGAGNNSPWTSSSAIQIGSNLMILVLGIGVPSLFIVLAITYHFVFGFTSQKRKQIAETRTNAKIKKQAQLEENKKRQEYLEQTREQIYEIARKNRGGLKIQTIITALNIDHDTMRSCLRKMNVKQEGDRIFFPDIEKSLKKDKKTK